MKIKFSTNNAAFKDPSGMKLWDDMYKEKEVTRILEIIIDKVNGGHRKDVIMDINGNKIGEWSL